jgi:hypothetical protein
MQVIDTKGRLGPILNDPGLIIPKAHLKKTCKKGSGALCCRYVALSTNGFSCVKNTSIASTLDKLVAEGKFKAQGNNCEGFGITYGKEANQQDSKESPLPQT